MVLLIFCCIYVTIFLLTCFYYQLENRLTKEKARKSAIFPLLFFLILMFIIMDVFFFAVKSFKLLFGLEYKTPAFMETFEENLFFKWM